MTQPLAHSRRSTVPPPQHRSQKEPSLRGCPVDFSPSSGHTSAPRPGRRGQGRAAQGAPEKVSLPDSARMSRRTSRGRLRSLPGECTEEPHRRLHPLSFPWWTGLSDYPASPRMRLKCVLRGERDGRRAACWRPRPLRLAVGPSPPRQAPPLCHAAPICPCTGHGGHSNPEAVPCFVP